MANPDLQIREGGKRSSNFVRGIKGLMNGEGGKGAYKQTKKGTYIARSAYHRLELDLQASLC